MLSRRSTPPVKEKQDVILDRLEKDPSDCGLTACRLPRDHRRRYNRNLLIFIAVIFMLVVLHTILRDPVDDQDEAGGLGRRGLLFLALVSAVTFCLTSSWEPRRRFLLSFSVPLFCFIAYNTWNKLAFMLGYQPPKIPSNSTHDKGPMLTVFLVDGLRADILQHEELPNMERLAARGCCVVQAPATFPTITGYAYWPLLTGIDGTRSGHLGTRYFDRRPAVGNWKNFYGLAGKLLDPGFEPQTRTLFEMGYSVATNSFVQRGANVIYKSGTEQQFSKALHVWWLPRFLRHIPWLGLVLVPTLVQHEERYMVRLLEMLRTAKPKIVWIVFASADNAAHAKGTASDSDYVASIRAADAAIGKYVRTMVERDGPGQHTFAIVSDHGEASGVIMENLDLCQAFSPLRAWRGDSKHWKGVFDEPLATFGKDKDVLIGISGDASANVYVKSRKGWKERTYEEELRAYDGGRNDGVSMDLIQSALDFTGVQLVAWSRTNGVIGIQTTLEGGGTSAVGVAKLEEDGTVSYRLESDGPCPLGYPANLASGSKRSAREWLEGTVDTPYPYALIRLLQYFTVPGLAPDMTVTALTGFDFGLDWEYYLHNFAGGHGGLHADHLLTPAIFSGAGVTPGVTIQTATVEDVGASLHHLAGSPVASLDFLQDRPDDPIATLVSEETTSSKSARDLVRGNPLSCVT